MPISDRLLIEKSNLIRAVSALITIQGQTTECLDLITVLIESIEKSLMVITEEYIKLLKTESTFNSPSMSGEALVSSFMASFMGSILLEIVMLHNNSIELKAPVLSNLLTKTDPAISLFLKVFYHEDA